MIKVKVLFAGLGGIGQRHLRNLLEIAGGSVEIYAYRIRREAFVLNDKLEVLENENLEQKYNIKVVSSLEQVWKLGINTVFICNPSSLHMEILLQALKNDCNIFIEKPLTHNYDGLEQLEVLLKRNKKITFIGYQNRFHPCIKKTKELLQKQSIGEIVSVQAEVGESIKNWHKYEDYRELYACKRELGGGVILTQIHELDYLIYFFDIPISVYALGGHLSDLEINVEDVANIIIKSKIGKNEVPISVYQDYLQNPPARKCKIVGSKGKIEFDLINAEITVYEENGRIKLHEQYEFERNDMFMEEMRCFLHAIDGEQSGEQIPIEEGIKSLRVALAAKESMETGKVIKL